MAIKTKTQQKNQLHSVSLEPTQNPDNVSLQATVISVFTKIIDSDTKITYAQLQSGTRTIYAAWKNSYFARDIMVHRKYAFSGKITHTAKAEYFSDPTFIDIPIVNRYIEFALAPPSQNRSIISKFAIALIVIAVAAGALTIAFNSDTLEQAIVGKNLEVSVNGK